MKQILQYSCGIYLLSVVSIYSVAKILLTELHSKCSNTSQHQSILVSTRKSTKLKNSKKKLTELPDKLISKILDKVPIADLITQVSLTSSRLDRLVKISCANRKALTLILGPNGKKFQDFNSNYFTSAQSIELQTTYFYRYSDLNLSPTANNLDFLSKTFPSIEKLQLCAQNHDHLDVSTIHLFEVVLTLLQNLSSQLTFLHVFLGFKPSNDTNQLSILYKNLFQSINKMSKLETLVFCTDNQLPTLKGQPLDLPILRQLKQFYLYVDAPNQGDLIVHSLKQYGPEAKKLQQIGLGCSVMINYELAELLLSKNLNLPLTHLRFFLIFPLNPNPKLIEQQLHLFRSLIQRNELFSVSLQVTLASASQWARLVTFVDSLIGTSSIEYLHLKLVSRQPLDMEMVGSEVDTLPTVSSLNYLHLQFASQTESKLTVELAKQYRTKLGIEKIFPYAHLRVTLV